MTSNSTGSESGTNFRVDEMPIRLSPRGPVVSPDPDLVDQTKNQIRTLVQEISDLARSNCTSEEFYEGFLLKTTAALASAGGVIWIKPPENQSLTVQYQINLSQTVLATDTTAQFQHTRLLERLVASAEPALVPPNSAVGEGDSGNPTGHLLIIGPLVVEQQVVGLVEIFQRPGGGPATQRGYLRFLTQMCELANEYLKNQRLQSLTEQQRLWRDLDQFSRLVHRGLNVKQTAYAIANEGRRFIECDRVSVAIEQSGRMRVVAVSGLDTLERRADQVKRLGELADVAVRAGRPVWYTGNEQDLAPQLERPLQQYLDKSHAKMVAILPLARELDKTETDRSESVSETQIIAALIVEQLNNSALSNSARLRCQRVAEHSQIAISNSVELLSIPFVRWLSKLRWLARPLERSRLSKTLTLAGFAFAMGFFFCFYPYPFTLGARGELIAESQQEIFAHVNGTLVNVYAPGDPSAKVEAGDVLAEMNNNDLMLQIERLEGELTKTAAQITTLQRQRVNRSKQNDRDQERRDSFYLEGELSKALAMQSSLTQELDLAKRQSELLTIRSPIRGRVIDWQLRRQLLGRPVNRGECLMTVIAPDTRWQVELQVPERRTGHLLATLENRKEPLVVSFSLASNPGKVFWGKLQVVDPTLDVFNTDGNATRVLVEFDNRQAAEELFRPGTRVTAKIHCGKQPIGWVFFHELIETVQGAYQFWF